MSDYANRGEPTKTGLLTLSILRKKTGEKSPAWLVANKPIWSVHPVKEVWVIGAQRFLTILGRSWRFQMRIWRKPIVRGMPLTIGSSALDWGISAALFGRIKRPLTPRMPPDDFHSLTPLISAKAHPYGRIDLNLD